MALEKKTRGRQKIELKKIENEEHKLVSFSKRRTGITKKATELVTLCGVEVGVLVFSPTGRPFTYGNPSFMSIASQFLEQHQENNKNNNISNNNSGINITRSLLDARRKQRVDKMNRLYNDMAEELEEELEAEQILRQELASHRTKEWWWMKSVEELCEAEAVRALAFYRELHDTLCRKVQETPFNNMAVHPQLLPQPPLMAAEGFPSYDDDVGQFLFPPTKPCYHGGNN